MPNIQIIRALAPMVKQVMDEAKAEGNPNWTRVEKQYKRLVDAIAQYEASPKKPLDSKHIREPEPPKPGDVTVYLKPATLTAKRG